MQGRLELLEAEGWIEPSERKVLETDTADLAGLDRMSENVVGFIGLPVGLVTNMVVNSVERLVPMAIEEPSVVAACSRAALIARAGKGVIASGGSRRIGAQLLVRTEVPFKTLRAFINERAKLFASDCRRRHPSVAAAGGGVASIELSNCEMIPDAYVYFLQLDPGDAMGANLAMDVAAEFGEYLSASLPVEIDGAIVSNFPCGKPAIASVAIPVEALARGALAGRDAAARIERLSKWAMADNCRLITHNKGILNGIEGVLKALGQDTRAASASLMTAALGRACDRGRCLTMGRKKKDCESCYDMFVRPLAVWGVVDDTLCGQFRGPVPCGTVGGAGPFMAATGLFLKLMRVKSRVDLAAVVASVGLLQNLAALHAIATGEILPGHMKLHARKGSARTRSGEVTNVVKVKFPARKKSVRPPPSPGKGVEKGSRDRRPPDGRRKR